jgi:hypothetical protein
MNLGPDWRMGDTIVVSITVGLALLIAVGVILFVLLT